MTSPHAEKIKIDFEHRQSAHCENGVTSNLLRFHDMELSEPLAFGIGGGLFFGYFPFIKLNFIPLTSFRHAPGKIFNTVTRRLGIKVVRKRFSDRDRAMKELNRLLGQGIPTALQTGVFWLPYFPSAYRFHFNAHNIVVYGRENGHYLISDPNVDHPVTCSYEDLQRARFARGALAPKGKLYYLVNVPNDVDLRRPIIKGIKETCFNMLRIPLPILGVRGIRYLAGKVRRWPAELGQEKAALHLGHLIRMQEEIGTGGAGFRFIFASFLQEASEILGRKDLLPIADAVTVVGDRWREFAVLGARNCKGRSSGGESYEQLADILLDCADQEQKIFTALIRLKL